MNRRSFLSALISLAAGLVGVRVAKATKPLKQTQPMATHKEFTGTMISKCTIPKSLAVQVQIECRPIWTRCPFRTPVA